MPTNIEIKAKIADINKLKELASALSKSEGTLITQEDTFFNALKGRLKLRVLQGKPSQLVYYERPDVAGPKQSDFHLTEIHNPDELKVTLGKALGIKGEVRKKRMLYMVGQTRVHVDEVHGLGDYAELEVMMQPGQTLVEGQKIAEELMAKLEIDESSLIQGAYMDLILKKGSSSTG